MLHISKLFKLFWLLSFKKNSRKYLSSLISVKGTWVVWSLLCSFMVKPVVERISSIPTIMFGFLALTVLCYFEFYANYVS